MARVVLDVDVIISALIAPRGTPRALIMAWEASRYDVVASEGIIHEVLEKLSGPRIGGAYLVTAEDIRWVTALLLREADLVLVPPDAVASVTGDPEDDYVLATARIGAANALVTGDRGLLALREHEGIRILNPRAFLDELNDEMGEAKPTTIEG